VIKEFDRFVRITNKKIFNKKYRNKGVAYKCIAFIERTNPYEPYHIHALVDKPSKLSEQQFKDILNECWPYGEVHLVEETIGCYLDYISKHKDKELLKHPFGDSFIASSAVLTNKL
jgi:hypothetical protein